MENRQAQQKIAYELAVTIIQLDTWWYLKRGEYTSDRAYLSTVFTGEPIHIDTFKSIVSGYQLTIYTCPDNLIKVGLEEQSVDAFIKSHNLKVMDRNDLE